jgi:hypothetical protein
MSGKKNLKIICDVCFSTVSKSYISRHKRTKKCIKIKNINLISDDKERQNQLEIKNQKASDVVNCDLCNSMVVRRYLSVHKTKQKCFRKTYIRNLINDRYIFFKSRERYLQ